jgi:hypothetical protein
VEGEATEVRISNGVGRVSNEDSIVFGGDLAIPSTDTTWVLTATGPGGTRTAEATLSVSGGSVPGSPGRPTLLAP